MVINDVNLTVFGEFTMTEAEFEKKTVVLNVPYASNGFKFDPMADEVYIKIVEAYHANRPVVIVSDTGVNPEEKRFYYLIDYSVDTSRYKFACTVGAETDILYVSTNGNITREVVENGSGGGGTVGEQAVEIIRLPYDGNGFDAQNDAPTKITSAINKGKLPVIVSNTSYVCGEDQYYYFAECNQDGFLVFKHDGQTETNTIRMDTNTGEFHLDRQFKDFKWLGTVRINDSDILHAEIDSMEGLGYIEKFSEFYILATIPPSAGAQIYIGSAMYKWMFFSSSCRSTTATKTVAIELKHVGDGWWRGQALAKDNVSSAFATTSGYDLYTNFRSNVSMGVKVNKLVFYGGTSAFPEGTLFEVYGK